MALVSFSANAIAEEGFGLPFTLSDTYIPVRPSHPQFPDIPTIYFPTWQLAASVDVDTKDANMQKNSPRFILKPPDKIIEQPKHTQNKCEAP